MLEKDLHEAIFGRQLELHYQPIVSLADRQLCGFEALIRWRHPTKGLLPPGHPYRVAVERPLRDGAADTSETVTVPGAGERLVLTHVVEGADGGRHGVLLVSDEVICAFGRIGDMFAMKRFGVNPDILTTAKGITSGFWIGLVIVLVLLAIFLLAEAYTGYGVLVAILALAAAVNLIP